MLDELAAERQQNAVTHAELRTLRALAVEVAELNERHAAALELLGEKQEELDAARMLNLNAATQ